MICHPCSKAYKAKDNGCHTANRVKCDHCGKEASCLPNRHFDIPQMRSQNRNMNFELSLDDYRDYLKQLEERAPHKENPEGWYRLIDKVKAKIKELEEKTNA